MKRIAWMILFGTLLLAALAMPTLAEDQDAVTRCALLIGNGDYVKAGSDLSAPPRDVAAMKAALEASAPRYDQIVVERDLTAGQIHAAIGDMAAKTTEDSVTLIYYSGHGYASSGGGLSGVDGVGYAFTTMESALSELKGKVIIVLDSCYSGSLIGKSALETPDLFNRSAIAAFSGPQAKAIDSGDKYHVITASRKTEESYAWPQYSIATYYLTKSMGYNMIGQVKAELQGDLNGDQKLSVSEAYQFAAPQVSAELAPAGYAQNMQMYPTVSGVTLVSRDEETTTPDQPRVQSITLDMTSAILGVGQKLELNADQSVWWNSSNEKYASVDPTTGVVTANRETGSKYVIITATLSGDDTVKASCRIKVVKAKHAVQAIRMPESRTARVGSSFRLPVKYSPASARNKTAKWFSSDEKVAQVKSGVVRAVGEGTAVITAVAPSGVTATCEVTVTPVKVTKIRLTRTKMTLLPGRSEQLVAGVAPSNAKDRSVAWSSSNESVATVDSDGIVTAVAPGRATIFATANDGGGAKAACRVTVPENAMRNAKPRATNGKLTTNAKNIYYEGEYLVIDLYYSNKTKKAQTIPQNGMLRLRLKPGAQAKDVMPITSASAAAQTLAPNRYTVVTFKVPLAQYPVVQNLDLRKADAWIG